MKLLTVRHTSRTWLAWARRLVKSLERLEKTRPLVSSFVESRAALEAALVARERKAEEAADRQDALGFEERDLEGAIRGLWLAAKGVDDGGLALRLLFPDGLYPEIKPQSAAQLDLAASLLARLLDPAQPGLEALRAVWAAALESRVAAFRAALALRDAADQAVAEAWEVELRRREQLKLASEVVRGQLMALIPHDARLRELIWPAPSRNRRPAGEDDEDAEGRASAFGPVATPAA